MKPSLLYQSLKFARFAVFSLALGAGTSALAQKPAAANSQPKILLAINEGGAANADATETILRFQELSRVVEKTLRLPVTIVAVRDRNSLLTALQRQAYALLLARPNDVPAQAIRDQAAIGWSMENGFFDVAVVNSVSATGRTWEKNGGRVIARSPELPNMPLIASPELSAAQVAKLRAALVALDSSENGKAMLKKIGLTGFKETSPQVFLDFLKWLGELEVAKQ